MNHETFFGSIMHRVSTIHFKIVIVFLQNVLKCQYEEQFVSTMFTVHHQDIFGKANDIHTIILSS